MNLFWNEDIQEFDIAFDSNNQDLRDAVILSMFCWSRANKDEVDPHQSRYGWWAKELGSKLFITFRAKITPDLLSNIKHIIEESLQWLINDGAVNEILVEVSNTAFNTVSASVVLTKPSGEKESFQFNNLWQPALGD